MADPFLISPGSVTRPQHRWLPPEFPNVTLFTPEQVPDEDRGDLRTLEAAEPVWVRVAYAEIGPLRTHGFAVAASAEAVIVQTTWQGRLQEVCARRRDVTRRQLRPGDHRH